MNELVFDKKTNFELEDFGNINEAPDEILDYGMLDSISHPTRCFVVIAGVDKNKHGRTGLKIKGSSSSRKISNFTQYDDLNHMSIVYCGIVIRWIGFGTAFEFDNGIERIVSPYLSSGTVR